MSGISFKNAKLFEKEIKKERESQQELISAVNNDLNRQLQPYGQFRQSTTTLLGRVRWLLFGIAPSTKVSQ